MLLAPFSSGPGLLAADALLGITLALVALKSGRAARLIADVVLVYYVVSTHFAGLFGAFIGVGLARYLLELDHMGSSFLAELNLPVLATLVTLLLLHRVLVERLRPRASRGGRRPWIALGVCVLLLTTLRLVPFPSRFAQF